MRRACPSVKWAPTRLRIKPVPVSGSRHPVRLRPSRRMRPSRLKSGVSLEYYARQAILARTRRGTVGLG
jgi:hypothetical protein